MPSVGGKLLAYLGVDPGVQGGIVLASANRILSSVCCSSGEFAVWGWIKKQRAIHDIQFAVIEKVWSYPGQGVASTFTFGRSYGFLLGCLIASGIPFEDCIPNKWQKALQITTRPKGMRDAAWKRQLLERAKIMFPRQVITKATADAALIARYCELTHGEKE